MCKIVKIDKKTKKRPFQQRFLQKLHQNFYYHCRNDMNFKKLAHVMLREYNSDDCHLGIQSELEILTIEQFMVDHNITDVAVKLTKIFKHIKTLTPQCPPNFRTEINQIRFLRHAVLMQSWATKVVATITSTKYATTALREQLQLEVEKKSRGSHLVPSSLYQRIGCTPQRRKAEQQGGNKSVGRNGERMLCNCCAGDDRFMRDSKGKYRKGIRSSSTTKWNSGHPCESQTRSSNGKFMS